MALEKEWQFFAENKTKWFKAHLGKFVLVKASNPGSASPLNGWNVTSGR
jgi:hypothetical protein